MLFKLLKGDTSGIKGIVTSINQLSQVGQTIKQAKTASAALNLASATIGTVDVSNLERYRSILYGLTDEQKALALSTSGLTAAQAKMTLTYSEGAFAETALSEAEANRIITQAGLTTATQALNAEQITSLATMTGLTEVQLRQALQEAGAVVTKEGDIVATQALNQEELKSALISAGCEKANVAETASLIAETAAKTAATEATAEFAGASSLLVGAFSKLSAIVVAHPIIAALAAITAGVALFVTKQKKHKEEIKKIAEEVTGTYESTINRLTTNKEDFDDISEEYATLSKGVDALGNNVSLTTDEYDRYHEVANKLAEITPSLVKAWDEQGNAILNVKGNIEGLTEAYEKEIVAANNAIITNSSALMEESSDVLTKSDLYTAGEFSQQERIDKLKTLAGKKGIVTKQDLEAFKSTYIDALTGEEVVSYQDLYDLLNRSGVDTTGIDWNNPDDFVKKWNSLTDKEKSSIDNYITKTTASLSEGLKNRRNIFKADLQNKLLSDTDYTNIGKNLQDVLYNMTDTIDNSVFEKLNTEDQIYDYVDKILTAFNSLSETDQKSVEEYVSLTTSWNNDEIPYEEYVEKMTAFSNLLTTLFDGDEETIKSFKILFDIPEEGELDKSREVFANRLGKNKITSTGETNGMPTEVQDKLVSQGTNVAETWYDSLKKSEREFVDNLSDEDLAEAVKFESTAQFDEWLDKLQAEADSHKIELRTNAGAVENLDSMKDAFDDLSTAYFASVKNQDSSGNATNYIASADDIQGVNDAFGGITEINADTVIADINTLNNALEAYDTTLIENKGDAEKAQAAADQLATAYVDLSDVLDNLTEENKDYYIEQLKANGITNAEEVVNSRLSKQYQKTRSALEKLSQSVAKNRKYLDAGVDAGQDYEDAIADIKADVQDLLTVYDDSGKEIEALTPEIDDSFITENLADIEAATEGDIDALKRLQLEVARINAAKAYVDVSLPSDVVEAQLDNLMDKVAQVDAMDIEVGASVDDTAFIASLQNMIESGQTTADAVSASFESMGYEAKWTPNKYTATIAKTILSNGTGNATADIQTAKGIASLEKQSVEMDIPSLTITRKNKSTGAKVSGYGGSSSPSSSGSGGSGDSGSDDSEETFDWIEVAIDRLENNLDKLSETIDNTYDTWESRNKAITDSIDEVNKEIELQKSAAERYLAEAESIDLSEEYKKKVREGKLDIETIKNDDELVDNINEYQTWLFFSHHTYYNIIMV